MLAALLPRAAFAHADLLGVTPENGAIVPRGTVIVRLVFSEPVTTLARGIRIVTPSRRLEPPVNQTSSTIAIPVDARIPGTYTIGFRVIDDDTHITRGVVAFSVEHASADAGRIASGHVDALAGVPRELEAIGRWLHYLGFALLYGVPVLSFVFSRSLVQPGRAIGAGLVLTILADVLLVLSQMSAIEPGRIVDLDAGGDVLASPFGRLLGIDLTGAIVAWAITPLLRSPHVRLGVTLLVADGVVVACVDGRMGHAMHGVPLWVSVAVSALHLAGMAVWFGVVFNVLAFVPRASPPQRAEALRGATVWAGAALIVAAATGAVLALGHFTSFGDSVTSVYGRMIALKVALFAAAAAIGFSAARAVAPSGRLVTEASLIGVALFFAGFALSSIPPR